MLSASVCSVWTLLLHAHVPCPYSESWGRGGPPCSVSAIHSFVVKGVTRSELLSSFFLVKLVDFSGDVTFGDDILGCCEFGRHP